MRSLTLCTAAVVMLLGSASICANESAPRAQPSRIEPVLVRVNAQGKVVQVSPAYKLPPKLEHLLRANLNELVLKPATDKHGKPVSSQFVVNMKLQAVRLDSGNYNARFTYVSATPVPASPMHWVRTPDHRLALGNFGGVDALKPLPPHYDHQMRSPSQNQGPHQTPAPPVHAPTTQSLAVASRPVAPRT